MKRIQQLGGVVALALFHMAAHASDAGAVALKYFKSVDSLDAAGLAQSLRSADLGNFKAALMPAFEEEHKAGQHRFLDASFGPGASYEALAKMPADTFFTHVTQLVMRPRPDQPLPQFEEPKMLGEVMETPTLIHVVVRETVKLQGQSESKVTLISTVREDNGAWKVIMPSEVGMAAIALRRQVDMMYSKPAHSKKGK